MISGVVLVAEALRLADTLGVDGETARTAPAGGPLAGAVAPAFAEDARFATALAAKDLALATATAPLPAVQAVSAALRQAAGEPGPAGADLSRAAARIRTRTTTTA
ncbi:hypothetical protein [Streptomyces sp. NRRL S-340]|uniref:hypothetical protein n=1 Tax=Streptomyces sp. NRRL S-340 TaxID=1463901 RepID=UPI000B019C75|nr:hypothetical protein [Streptomyces sp. NRRL S-340]